MAGAAAPGTVATASGQGTDPGEVVYPRKAANALKEPSIGRDVGAV